MDRKLVDNIHIEKEYLNTIKERIDTKVYSKTFIGHNNRVKSVAISSDNRYIASGSDDKTIKLWNIESGDLIKTFEDHKDWVNSVSISSDSRYIVSGSIDKTIKLWDIESGDLVKTFECHSSRVNSVALSSDNRYIVSGNSDKTIKLWDIKSGELIKTFEGHENWVKSVALSSDNKYIISGSDDKTIKLWDTESGKIIKSFSNYYLVNSVAISSDNRYIVLGSDDRSIKMWNIEELIFDNVLNIKSIIPQKIVENLLLKDDEIRADIAPYNFKILEDTNMGHWSLWSGGKIDNKNYIELKLQQKLVARDPKSSIIEGGVVGIDFGTKSTVVVYQKDSIKIKPMRVGMGNFDAKIEPKHFENPTVIEFNNLQEFIESYKKREGRPYTKWNDITISHTAMSSLLNSKSEFFNSYLFELKQWAGDKNKKLKIVDKTGYVLDLPPFLELSEDDINPIEIYAYYLGLYINNQHRGIFLNYILSFPVTYEVDIREKIIESFKKGIKKSLPQELHFQKEEIDKLSVFQGASEPAAYALVALQEYGFEPVDDEIVFYGVFDFGGGTTDFDFGIYREANGKKERRYDFVIEHFGAGGDKYLGGENLLDLLAFEVFKKNQDKLREGKFQFTKPSECDEFLGSEMLISNSREASSNTTSLVERLRGLWESDGKDLSDYDKGVIGVRLTNINGEIDANFELEIDKDELLAILRERIAKGVDNFFEKLRLTISKYSEFLPKDFVINIFLAGNSSKSYIVKELFNSKIEETKKDMKNEFETNIKDDIFKLFDPLSNSSEDMEKPTGKTGVAFGLIKSRKGGKVLVIDHNIEQDEIDFKYYIGEEKRGRFKVIINSDFEYNKWVDFIDAGEDRFEIFYSSLPRVSTNKVPIDDESIKKLNLQIDVVNEDAMVYIRLINPTTIEYVVALEDEIEKDKYLGKITKVELKG